MAQTDEATVAAAVDVGQTEALATYEISTQTDEAIVAAAVAQTEAAATYEISTQTSTVTELPSTSTNPLSLPSTSANPLSESSAEADYTPLDGDIIRVVDNPTYQPTSSLDTGSPSSPHPVDDQIDGGNPYQFHRHRLYTVKRLFLYLCELIEQM